MVVIRWVLPLLAVLLLAGCECIDEEGTVYTCSCTRTCQGATAPWSMPSACVQETPTLTALSRCESSCDPTATCTACSCTPASTCVIEHNCR